MQLYCKIRGLTETSPSAVRSSPRSSRKYRTKLEYSTLSKDSIASGESLEHFFVLSWAYWLPGSPFLEGDLDVSVFGVSGKLEVVEFAFARTQCRDGRAPAVAVSGSSMLP